LNNLQGYFTNRGYPLDFIRTSFNKALESNTRPIRDEDEEMEDKQHSIMVIPYHPMNPGFATCISQLWQTHKHMIQDKIKKPIVAYTRPKNLKECLTRARYGPSAIPAPKFDPSKIVINRPTSTYDRNQLKAPIKHIMFKCNCNFAITEQFNTLEQALYSEQWRIYQALHCDCTQLNILPVQVQHKFHVKCTDCNFKHTIESTKTVSRITDEIMHSMDTTQKSLNRATKIIKACSLNCKICLMQNYNADIKDQLGCHYKYLPFDCKAKYVVYIIQCQHCNVVYVGQTRGQLKCRISAHLSNIRKFKNTSMARHFNSPGHIVWRDFKIGIIDMITPSNTGLNIREATWINLLNTIATGINEKDEARLTLDYQSLAVSRHFRHSPTCLPKITHHIREVSTLALQQYKRIPWVRTRHPNKLQRPTANDLQSSTASTPHVPRVPQVRGTLFPVLINSQAGKQCMYLAIIILVFV
jgi:hypothetical protein